MSLSSVLFGLTIALSNFQPDIKTFGVKHLDLAMHFDIVPAHDLPPDVQAAIFNRAFAGYLVGWNEIDAAGLAKLICAQGIDLCHSRFVRANGALVGFGYIDRTGNVSRLASMGVVPDARGSGAAQFLVSHLFDDARSRPDEAVMLEVFEQNLPALALYRRNKFRELMRLFGWRRVAQKIEMQIDGNLEEISLLAANRICGPLEFPDIPWQISRHAVAKLTDARGYGIGGVCVVISNPVITPIRIHALLGYDSANGATARNVLAAVLEKFAEKEFFAREIFPEQFGPAIFEPLGFVPEPLNQILMRRDLN